MEKISIVAIIGSHKEELFKRFNACTDEETILLPLQKQEKGQQYMTTIVKDGIKYGRPKADIGDALLIDDIEELKQIDAQGYIIMIICGVQDQDEDIVNEVADLYGVIVVP